MVEPWPLIALLSRFGLAGLVNTALGFSVIALLDVGLHVRPALANAAGYLAGMGSGFVLNRQFVFRSRAAPRTVGPKYLMAVCLAFALNQAILKVAGSLFGTGAAPHLAAQATAMVSYTSSLFLACRFWVFAPSKGPPETEVISRKPETP